MGGDDGTGSDGSKVHFITRRALNGPVQWGVEHSEVTVEQSESYFEVYVCSQMSRGEGVGRLE